MYWLIIIHVYKLCGILNNNILIKMTIPKIFISYSHDSLEHKQWVLELGSRLRNNGIDAI